MARSLFVLLLLLGAVLALASGASRPASSAVPLIQGDANCDGVVDAEDSLEVLSAVAGIEDDGGCAEPGGNVDCDDGLTPLDALGLLRFVADPGGQPPNGTCPTIGSALTPTPLVTPSSTENPSPTPSPTATFTPPPSLTPTASPTDSPAPSPSPRPCIPPAGPLGIPPTETPLLTATPRPTPIANGYTLTQIAPEAVFEEMLDAIVVPGKPDELVVVTQPGYLWRISISGAFEPELFGDLSELTESVPDEGLLSAVFPPGSSVGIYVNYTLGETYYKPGLPLPADPKRNRIAHFDVVNGTVDVASEQVIIEVPQPHQWHNVAGMAFGPDGYLYVGSGDGGGTGGEFDSGQDIENLLGVIFRIAPDPDGGYTVPPDNPFADGPDGCADEVWAYGLRHPWRFSFDEATGELWAGDVGQLTIEEVDQIVRGGNYGWNVMEGGACYPPNQPQTCDGSGFLPPRAQYPHAGPGGNGCAVQGGHVYRGDALTELSGYFIYGDYCTGRVWAVNTVGDTPPIQLVNSDVSITAFVQLLGSGEIVAVGQDEGLFLLERP